MFVFAWLFFCLSILLSPLMASWFMPLFVMAVSVAILADSDRNYLVIAAMGVLHHAWFGYDADILMLVMGAMFAAYAIQTFGRVPDRTISTIVVSFFVVHLALTLAFHPELQHPIIFTTAFLRAAVAWFVIRYFERKAQLQYV